MNILVGYDRSNVAKEALKLAKKHARAFDAKVYVVRSLAQSREMNRDDIQKAEQELETIKRSFRDDETSAAPGRISGLPLTIHSQTSS